MAKRNDLSKVKSCYSIYKNEDYVILSGKNIWIFKPDGTQVAQCKTIRNPWKVAFLPGNKLLVQGGSDHAYHLLSLEDGSTIWQLPLDKKRYMSARRFAISPDSTMAYDYYTIESTLHFLKIQLIDEPDMLAFPIEGGYALTADIFCDSDEEVCLLQSQLVEVAGRKFAQNGIMLQQWLFEGSSCYWRQQWEVEKRASPKLFDGENVLYSDLSVYNIHAKQEFSLLENEDSWTPPNYSALEYIYDKYEKLLVLAYDEFTVVIDCVNRHRIAQYAAPTEMSASGKKLARMSAGCLVNGEFWMGTEQGVVRKPFPLIEDIPEYDHLTLDDVLRAK